ncbi:hypothetical protein A2U01_0086552, partial [Trifolium medium]|nr:hypothetical protein [Trifolium medium]
DITEEFQVPGENQRASSLRLVVARSATTQEQAHSLWLADRLAQRPLKNMRAFCGGLSLNPPKNPIFHVINP